MRNLIKSTNEEKEFEYIPFDIEEAKKNPERIRTRSGNRVDILTFSSRNPFHPIYAELVDYDNVLYEYSKDGIFQNNGSHSNVDLVLLKKIPKEEYSIPEDLINISQKDIETEAECCYTCQDKRMFKEGMNRAIEIIRKRIEDYARNEGK